MDNKDKATNEMERDHEQEEEQNPNNNNNNNNNNNELSVQEEERGANLEQQQQQQQQQQPLRARTPFTDLSQVDADLVLARTLQEQEREYSRLRMNSEGSDYGSWEAGTYFHDDDYDDFGGADDESDAVDNENDGYDGIDLDDEDKDDEDEDAFDVHAHDESEDDIINPSIEYDSDVFSSDEAYARALQDAEEREMAARLLALAGINDRDVEDPEDHSDSLDTWEDVDPDELSYEELLALGEVVGTESRGLSTDTIASLPTINYKNGSSQNGSNDSCVICRLDFEDGETLTVLSCNHSYHSECVNNWLKINKVCPVCSAEVSTSGHS